MAALAEITLEEYEVCCRGGEVISATCSSGDVLSTSGENNGLCHVTRGTKHPVEHTATQNQMICHFRQEAITTEHVKHFLPSHVFVNIWKLQLLFQPRHVARMFPTCCGVGGGESGVIAFVLAGC